MKKKRQSSKCEHEWVDVKRSTSYASINITLKCTKCGMYIGGVDSYKDIEADRLNPLKSSYP